jgi:hypothetical protein
VTLSDVNVIGTHEKGPFSALNVGCVPAIIGGIALSAASSIGAAGD